MGHLSPYLKKYKKETVIAPLFKMLEACFDLLVPLIVARIIDVGIKNGDTRYILMHFAILIGMALVGLSCTVVALSLHSILPRVPPSAPPRDFGMSFLPKSAPLALKNWIRQGPPRLSHV